MARIATVHILIDVESDPEACDFLSETLSDMPYVIDWAHASVPPNGFGEYTGLYLATGDYTEGDFLDAADSLR